LAGAMFAGRRFPRIFSALSSEPFRLTDPDAGSGLGDGADDIVGVIFSERVPVVEDGSTIVLVGVSVGMDVTGVAEEFPVMGRVGIGVPVTGVVLSDGAGAVVSEAITRREDSVMFVAFVETVTFASGPALACRQTNMRKKIMRTHPDFVG
jgi:hypothetical protein